MRDELIRLLQSPDSWALNGTSLGTIRDFFKEHFNFLLDISVKTHPLGFFYASEQISDGVNLRYHLWPALWQMTSLEQGKEDHDHTYSLTSLIIAGKLRHRTFEAIDSESGDFEVLAVNYEGTDSKLSRTGKLVNMNCVGDRTYGPGEIYKLEPGTIHRAIPVALPMATLVLTVDGKTANSPRVFSRAGETHNTSFHRDKLSESEKRQFAESLMDL
jgi:hypothetical protein